MVGKKRKGRVPRPVRHKP